MKVAVLEAAGLALSVTVMPKEKFPAAVGVPARTPVLLLSKRPAGRVEPFATDQV